MVDGMVVKMGGHGLGCHIVCGTLHRRKGVDLLSDRKYHDTARMLSGGTPDPYAALDDPVDLTVPLVDAAFFIVPFHKTEGGLIRKGADGTCPEGLSLAKNNLRVVMRLTLVLTGEV